MAYDYDKLYGDTRNALGQPTSIFVNFFGELDQPNLRVLDVGCGQGRDAVFIARLGHRVVGVDISPNGIRDLREAAIKENLMVDDVVADITAYKPEGLFDVVLIDRTLHMLDRTSRVTVLNSLMNHVNDEGWLLIADEASNISDFKAAAQAHELDWTTHFTERGYLFLRLS